MAAALITAVTLSIAGLCAVVGYGFLAVTPADLLRHATLAVFVTLVVLLSHSMTIFYLIGKGKAIRDAASEAGLPPHYAETIAALRRPVFSNGTLALAVTMVTAIVGGGVDTGILPTIVHSALGIAAVGANLWAFKAELAALSAATRITGEVDALIIGRSSQ